ncbi:hypothetical protein [Streptomyces sp. NPDC020983]|uniref:hypothetical protein n=1 Tax=Streptomyces sp. NPDC020983 TaxID=3365106 RepID=UPI0037B27D15
MELTAADFEAWVEQAPIGVHPSLVHRLARPVPLTQHEPPAIPASLRGPNYPED